MVGCSYPSGRKVRVTPSLVLAVNGGALAPTGNGRTMVGSFGISAFAATTRVALRIPAQNIAVCMVGLFTRVGRLRTAKRALALSCGQRAETYGGARHHPSRS